MENIFGGEIRKIENDIAYLNSYIDRYAFLSGEDDLYNVNFIENFDNDQNSYIYDSSVPVSIPDRNNSNFSSTESAHVDSFTGTLKFSGKIESVLTPITKENIESIQYFTNFPKEHISSDTGIENVLTGNSNNSWNLTVKSPFLINENIFLNQRYSLYNKYANSIKGAEVAIEIVFKLPVSGSRLRISPNVGAGLYLTQAVVGQAITNAEQASNTENAKQALMTKSIYSDRNIDIDFPEKNIKSITLFFKQKNYKRTKVTPVQSELNAKLVNYISGLIRVERKKNHDTLQDYVINYFLKDLDKSYVLRNKSVYSYDYTKDYPTSGSKRDINLLREIQKEKLPVDIDARNKFKNADLISNMVFAIISFSLGSKMRGLNSSTYIESNLRSSIKSIVDYNSGGLIPLGDSNNAEKNLHLLTELSSSFNKTDAINLVNNSENTGMYEYMFSIKNISLFSIVNKTLVQNKRSHYISKRLPLNARPLSVKLLAEEIDTTLSSNSSLDLTSPTSIEYSVSIKDNPSSESDWIPILPYTKSSIDAELLIPNINDQGSVKARLRFSPLPESVTVYENGKILPSSNYSIQGNLITYRWNQSATYAASYTPLNISVAKEVALFSRSLASPILTTFSLNGRTGESFSSVSDDMSVTLSYIPYVDRSKFVGATYNIYTGTITSSNSSFGNFDYSSYSPVKIVFEDGTTAINLTNYVLSNNQIPSFPSIDGYYFIQFDNRVIFNKKPTQSFRVIYQYVPDIFRYRVVFRSLNSTTENYSIDRLLFKFSSEKENAVVNNFIRYDNMFKAKLI
jgi:hypothetical protein